MVPEPVTAISPPMFTALLAEALKEPPLREKPFVTVIVTGKEEELASEKSPPVITKAPTFRLVNVWELALRVFN